MNMLCGIWRSPLLTFFWNGLYRASSIFRRCALFSGGIAVCAYAQMVDELRQNPFELGGRGGEETDQKRRHVNSQFSVVKAGFWSLIFGIPKSILVRQFYTIDEFLNLEANEKNTF